ncbi:MAG: hypothetical protein ACK5NN_03150, partial [Sphingomonadaceae bacterium]
ESGTSSKDEELDTLRQQMAAMQKKLDDLDKEALREHVALHGFVHMLSDSFWLSISAAHIL